MKFKKIGFGLSTLAALSVIPISVITMPLVLNQPVQALCVGDGFCDDNRAEPVCGGLENPPCFTKAYQTEDNAILFQFSGGGNFYNVRYRFRGGEKQVENRSGSFVLRKVKPNALYRIKVQSCQSRFLASSICSPWGEEVFRTR